MNHEPITLKSAPDPQMVEIPTDSGFDWARYSHLDISEEVMREAFAKDKVIVELYAKAESIKLGAKRYDDRIAEIQAELADVDVELDGLLAQARVLDAKARTLRGAIASNKHHKSVAGAKISEVIRRILVRRQHLCRKVVNERLAVIGREIKDDVAKRVTKMRHDGLSFTPGRARFDIESLSEELKPKEDNGTHQEE